MTIALGNVLTYIAVLTSFSFLDFYFFLFFVSLFGRFHFHYHIAFIDLRASEYFIAILI